MNLKFLLLLIASLFIISCISVENTENTEDPFELSTGDISDRSIGEGILDIGDREISTSTIDWIQPPRPSDGYQEYSDFRVSTELVGNFNVIQTCNQNIIRTPQANISWVSNSLTPDQMRLDVTHYGTRRGFVPNGYTSVDISRDSLNVFKNPNSGDEELDRNSTLPDLYVIWSDLFANENLGQSNSNLIKVEGLEAGVNYRWRLVGLIDGQVVATPSQMMTASVCVADLKN